ncbi:MAG: Gfo/Idh/MocA family oxidoreductase [Lactovum sp.]
MERKLNVAYVGFGKSTNRYHIPYLLTRDKFNISRIVSPHLNKRIEQKILEMKGTIFSTSLSDILKDETIDLVVIVTPAQTHYELIEHCLSAGKNVLCDKPIVEKSEELKNLIDIAKEKNLFFMPFQNRRFDSDFLTLKNIIKKGYLGKLTDLTVHMDHYRPQDINPSTKNFDGAWYGHGVHLVDQIISLFGKPKEVQYDIRTVRGEGADDYFSVNLIYDDFRATLSASETAVIPHPKWTLYGESGVFIKSTVDQQENDLKLGILPASKGFGLDNPNDYGKVTYFNQNGDRIEKTLPTERGDYARVYDSIYDTIVLGKEKLVSDEQMLQVVEILENGFLKV